MPRSIPLTTRSAGITESGKVVPFKLTEETEKEYAERLGKAMSIHYTGDLEEYEAV